MLVCPKRCYRYRLISGPGQADVIVTRGVRFPLPLLWFSMRTYRLGGGPKALVNRRDTRQLLAKNLM